MRPTHLNMSGMPEPKGYLGWWGNMGSYGQKGIVTYSVSPFKQRAFAGAMRGYLFNGYTRIMAQAPYWVVPFAIGYTTYSWGKKRYEWLQSKEGHASHEE